MSYMHLGPLFFVFYLTGIAQADFTNCYQVDTLTNYRLYWDLSVPGRISFLIQAQTSGWIGLGLSTGPPYPRISNGNMSDIWVGWVDRNSASPCAEGCVYDYHVSDYQQPTLDPPRDQSLQFISANYSSNVTSVAFSRALAKNDSYDRDISIDGITTFIWALNPEPTATPLPDGSSFPMHNPATKGVINVPLGTPSQCRSTPSPSGNSFTNDDGTYTLKWTIADNAITLTITATTKGWLAVGFSHTAEMPNSDMYVGWIDPAGKITMTDRYATEYAMPSADTSMGGKNDVQNVARGTDGDTGSTSITFTRPLDTGDKYDVALEPGNIYLLWAYGSDNSVDYAAQTFSEHIAKGIVQVDLFSGCISLERESGPDLMRIHGEIMLISICVLIFSGILIARYFKSILSKWFYFHAILQTVGFAGILSAVVLAFIAKNNIFVPNLHPILGIITFCLFGLEVILGFTSHFKFDPARRKPPVFPDKMHWWLGRITFLLALVTIVFGLLAYGAPFKTMILYIVYLGLGLLVIVYLQCAVGQTHETHNDESMPLSSGVSSRSVIEYTEVSSTEYVSKKPLIALALMVVAALVLLLVGFFFRTSDEPGFSGEARLCLRFDDYVIPTNSSSYICKGFKLPTDKYYHLTQFEAIRDNQLMLSNLMLYKTEEFLGDGYFPCDPMPRASTPLYAWAPGAADSFTFPSNVGFRVGKSSIQNLVLQLHYYNPMFLENRTDSSGVRLTMTSNLLPIDAGYLTSGVADSAIKIPSRTNYYEVAGVCPIGAVEQVDRTINYTVFGSGVHMHTLGQQIYANQYREDPLSGEYTRVGIVGCDDYYTFDDQKTVNVSATVRVGDIFVTHCIYNTTQKGEETLGCESSECEMCLAYIWYYPKIGTETVNCLSTQTVVDRNSTEHQCSID
eukprot:Phypoly_transcript_02604.p1 GENE.Phypoly_transcript_02604~~Phypoly_transcript_02604.p1  ORF type:complete len:907 (+),score=72.96 Phypoly_transcript_02604:3-2723(+)